MTSDTVQGNRDENDKTDEVGDPSPHPGSEEHHHTLESADLQPEDDQSKNQNGTAPNQSDIADDSKDEGTLHGNSQKTELSPAETNRVVIENIEKYAEMVDNDLRWKERLKVLTLDVVLGIPYYELWRSDANAHFRRSVILKKRKNQLTSKGD